VAPLGDPISVEIEGQEISLRRAEAALILVKEN
jgi:Fe2+ transport system protein FeoA